MRAGLVERLEHLAVDVELELLRGGVSYPNRPRPFVAGEPVELALVESPLARDPVHDLHVGRIAGDGAQEPLPPDDRLFAVAAAEHREQRERRVAQPAVAVVPVPDAADLLRKRGQLLV